MAYPKVWVMRAGGYGEDEEAEKLSPEIQAELPLKRVWMLVPEDSATE